MKWIALPVLVVLLLCYINVLLFNIACGHELVVALGAVQ